MSYKQTIHDQLVRINELSKSKSVSANFSPERPKSPHDPSIILEKIDEDGLNSQGSNKRDTKFNSKLNEKL